MSEIISTRNHHDIYDFVNPLKNPALRASTLGRSVIITGAGEGIGRGIAEQFAHAGASTFFLTVYSNQEALNATAARVKLINPYARVHTQLLDHTSTSAVDDLFSTVKRELGTSADILMNNAGNSSHFSEVASGDVGSWWASMESLLKGPYLMGRAFIRSALEEKRESKATECGIGRGVIVHTSSVASYYSVGECSAYQVAKIALNRLSEFIRIDHEKDGITSISLHPGGVNTPWWDDIPLTNPLHQMRLRIAVDTLALAGGVAVYLTTPHASYLSGRFVSVNWDLEELARKKEEIVKKGLLLMTARGDAAPVPF